MATDRVLTQDEIDSVFRKAQGTQHTDDPAQRAQPYDFRRPTAARVRERLWNPEGSLVVAQPFGMGWTLNVGKLLGSLRRRQDTP